MRFLFQLNHPAHFHLFKNTINSLSNNNHEVLISIKDKDILKELVKNYEHVIISNRYRDKRIFNIISSLIKRDYNLLRISRKFKPDIMIGTSPEISHVSLLTCIPSIFFAEDDVNLSFMIFLGAFTCYPFFSSIVSPACVKNSIWTKKTTFYNGFQKLAYLHPNVFKPDRKMVNIENGTRFFILRLSSLTSYHDFNEQGLNNNILNSIITILEPHGKILITSERELPPEYVKYRFTGNIQDIHQYLFYCDLFIGDSQSMAVECAILGTPNIRFNSFVGRISVLEELENKYKLTIGISSDKSEQLLGTIRKIITDENIRREFRSNRDKLLHDKIDVTKFMTWYIESFPESKRIIKKNPSFQDKFH